MLPSLSIGREWLGGMTIGHLFVDSLGVSQLTTSGSITEYWQGMVSVLNDSFDFDQSKNTLVPTPV